VSDAVDVVREILQLAGAMEVDALTAHLADDIVMELPFAPEGYAREHLGRDAVVKFQRAAARSFSTFAMVIDRVIETTDPRVVIAEHHSDGVAVPTGRPYRNRYVTIFELDGDGRVRRWTEYYDPTVVTGAFGAS
jgi:ketosteroid isomerase-like protein